jgi:hypothetical protein
VGAVALGILAGLALGGNLRTLSDAHFRWWPLALVGFALQLVPVPERPGQLDHLLAVGLLIASYGVLLTFVLLNLRYSGFWLVGLGFALNTLVVVLNGGMPVSDHALHVAAGSEYGSTLHNLVTSGGAKHHLERPDDVLTQLTDVIPIGTPVHNVFSVGDLVALFGVGWVMAEATKGPPGQHRVRFKRGWRVWLAAASPNGSGALRIPRGRHEPVGHRRPRLSSGTAAR